MKKLIFILVLVLASLACGTKTQEWQTRGWTVTPSQVVTQVLPTQTPYFIEITQTPQPTEIMTGTPQMYLCVTANETLYLRPSANMSGSPIVTLKNGQRITDLGGRDNGFWFVKVDAQQGWVFGKFVVGC